MRNKTIQEILDSTSQEIEEFVAEYARNIIYHPISSFSYEELPKLEEIYKEAVGNKKESLIYKETFLLTSYVKTIINQLKQLKE